jgi:polysaccharide deacetylase family protein (PEP-CTERM system associated)
MTGETKLLDKPDAANDDVGKPALRSADGPIVNAMTVDIEDYFQVQALAKVIARDDWESLPRRVELNTNRVLDLFAEAGVKGTFFTLGWVAERHPQLVRRIVGEGHELASHGWQHVRADDQAPEIFREDVRRTKRVLEDCSGTAVLGYRAASFSIGRRNPWALGVLDEEGYTYSSSIYPVRHDLYGMPEAPRFPYRPLPDRRFREFPITTAHRFGRNWPTGGGGFFRLLPYRVSATTIRLVHRDDRKPCVFYFHPWEIDPDQPVQSGLTLKSRFRHYTNLGRMEGKLRRLLRDFAWSRMDRVLDADLPP